MAVDLVVKRESSFLARTLGTTETSDLLWILGGLTLVIWCLESFFEYLQSLCWRRLAQRVQHALRLEAFSQAVHRDLAWFEQETTGNFVTTLGEDVHQLERFLDGGMNHIIQLICSTVLISAVFFYISPLIAVISLLPLPLIALWSRYFHRKLLPLYQRTRAASQDIAMALSNAFGGIVVVKSFQKEHHEIQKLQELSRRYVKANNHAIATSSAFNPTVRLLILAGFLCTLIVGGFMCLRGDMSVGSYSALIFLTQRLLWPFTTLAEVVDQYQRAMASTARIMKFIHLPHHPSSERFSACAPPDVSCGPSSFPTGDSLTSTRVSASTSSPSSSVITSVTYHDVGFTYPNYASGESSVHSYPSPLPPAGDLSSAPSSIPAPTLSGINITAHRGEVIGICGATGGGKSTLIKLLMGSTRLLTEPSPLMSAISIP